MNSKDFLHYTDPAALRPEAATVPTLCGLNLNTPATTPSLSDYQQALHAPLCPACEAAALLIENGQVNR